MDDLFAEEVQVRTKSADLLGTQIRFVCVDEEHKQIAKYVPLVNWNSDNAIVASFDTFLKNSGKTPESSAILEIGSGLGIPSIFIAKNYPFSRLDINEGDATAMEFIRQNVGLNQPYPTKEINFLEFWWFANLEHLSPEQQSAAGRQYDLIIGSDVIYNPDSVQSMLFTIKTMLKPDGLCLLANFYSRFYKNEAQFFQRAAEFGLGVEVSKTGEKGETIQCILRKLADQ